jgi:hypothetical protein
MNDVRDYTRLYWLLWSMILIGAMIARFALLPQYPYWIAIYGGLAGALFLGASYWEGRRLMNYLRPRHQQHWQTFTHVEGFGPGMDGLAAFRFVMSKDDLGDPAVRVMKQCHVRLLILILAIWLSGPIVMLILS